MAVIGPPRRTLAQASERTPGLGQLTSSAMPNMQNPETANTTVAPAPPLSSAPRKRRPMNTLLSSPCA